MNFSKPPPAHFYIGLPFVGKKKIVCQDYIEEEGRSKSASMVAKAQANKELSLINSVEDLKRSHGWLFFRGKGVFSSSGNRSYIPLQSSPNQKIHPKSRMTYFCTTKGTLKHSLSFGM